MDQHFKRILNLVRRTGDRIVVTDQNGEDAYVLMGLDAYESLIEAQEFSKDLAVEQSMHRDSFMTDVPPLPAQEEVPPETHLEDQVQHDVRIWEAMHAAGEPGQTWDMAKLSEEEKREVEQAYQNLHTERTETKTTATAQASTPLETASETASLKQTDEELGEEQFYLEPVE